MGFAGNAFFHAEFLWELSIIENASQGNLKRSMVEVVYVG